MSFSKTYSIAEEIASGSLNIDKLKNELLASGAIDSISSISSSSSSVTISGGTILDLPTLNNTVYNHIAESLSDKKAKKVLAIDEKTRAIIAAGFTFDGNQFSLSTQAQTNWLGLHVLQSLFTWPMGITNNQDATYYLAQVNLVPFIAAGSTVIATAVGMGRAMKIAVNAAANQAALDAVVDTR